MTLRRSASSRASPSHFGSRSSSANTMDLIATFAVSELVATALSSALELVGAADKRGEKQIKKSPEPNDEISESVDGANRVASLNH